MKKPIRMCSQEFIFNFEFDENEDNPVLDLVVTKKEDGYTKIVNHIKGEVAEEIYKKALEVTL